MSNLILIHQQEEFVSYSLPLFPFHFLPCHGSLNSHSQTLSPQEDCWSAMKIASFLIHSFWRVIEVRAARHNPTPTSDAGLTSLCVSLIGHASQRLVISPLMSRCQWRRVIPRESTARCHGCQVPELFHLHSNTDARMNGEQAPNLLSGLRGQDETRKMARSWNQRANSSGPFWFAKKFPLKSDGKCFRSIRIKQLRASKSFIAVAQSCVGVLVVGVFVSGLICFFIPMIKPFLFFFNSSLRRRPTGNRQLQLSQAGGHHAIVRKRRPELCDGDAQQAEVRGLSAQRLHHPRRHRGEEDVFHSAWRRQRDHQVQQGDEADRWILLRRYVSLFPIYGCRCHAARIPSPNAFINMDGRAQRRAVHGEFSRRSGF